MGIDLNKDFFGTAKTSTRKNFPRGYRADVIKLQDDKCAKCGKKFTSLNPPELDHKNGKNWDISWKNCQALHSGCHSAKSRKETTKRAAAKKKTKSGSKSVDFGGIFKF